MKNKYFNVYMTVCGVMMERDRLYHKKLLKGAPRSNLSDGDIFTTDMFSIA